MSNSKEKICSIISEHIEELKNIQNSKFCNGVLTRKIVDIGLDVQDLSLARKLLTD